MRALSRGSAFGILVVVLLLGFGIIGVSAVGILNWSNPAPSPVHYTDQQMAAIVQQAHDQNAQYLAQFESSGKDPHSLPVVEVASYGAGVGSIREAATAADAVVYARVSATTFAVNPSGGLPLARSHLEVMSVLKGPSFSGLDVAQLGGPVASGDAGALAELDSSPLVLTGDELVLFLAHSDPGRWSALPGAGTFFARQGRITTAEHNPVGAQVNGMDVASFLSLVRSVIPGR